MVERPAVPTPAARPEDIDLYEASLLHGGTPQRRASLLQSSLQSARQGGTPQRRASLPARLSS